jgi:hypothetical protein
LSTRKKKGKGCIFIKLCKGMYGLPPVVQIANDRLAKHLALWAHTSNPNTLPAYSAMKLATLSLHYILMILVSNTLDATECAAPHQSPLGKAKNSSGLPSSGITNS